MSQYVDSQTKAFTAAGTIAQFQRVVLGSGGTITAAVLADREIGTAVTGGVTGDTIAVRLRTACGSHKAIAAAAIAAGAPVFSAAAGKVSVSASGAFNLGICLEAAGANNDVIEIMYSTPGAVV